MRPGSRSARTALGVLIALALGTAGCGPSSDTSETAINEPTATDVAESDTTQATTSTSEARTSTTAVQDQAEALDEFGRCEPGDPDRRVVVGGPLEVGNVRSLTMLKEQSNVPASSATPVEIEVLQSGAEGTQLRWTSSSSVVSGIEVPPELESILDDVPLQRIEYLIDAEGFYAGVTNVEDVRQDALDTLDVIGPLLGDADITAQIEDLYRNLPDLQVELLFAEGATVFHSFDGLTLNPGEVIEFDDQLPNGFGGEPFPSTTTISIDEVADVDGCLAVTITTNPDPSEFARIVWESVESAFGTRPDDADVLEQFNVRNEVTARVDPSSGAVRSVVATQRITVDGETRVDTTTIREAVDDS